ncbi:MAG: PSD1 and planctomycete cytochrome C domain-containing protein [Bryobacteraceae bacterium]
MPHTPFLRLIFLGVCAAVAIAAPAADEPSFATGVQPILQARCTSCHGATPQGKLDLRSPESILKGGASGPAIVPGVAEKSLLITKVITGQMPPGKTKLTGVEIDQLRGWIDRALPTQTGALPVVKEREALAVFQARCNRCHGGLEKQGGLDLRTVESRLKGGKSGPAFVPGKPEESLLYQRIVNGQMPPAKMAKDLAIELPTDAETRKIRAWIAEGGPAPEPQAAPVTALVKESDRKFWSFQPPVRPLVPSVKNGALVRNPIDAFLLQKLESKNLKYSPEAGRLTLMRRVYLDLIGMLPTEAEIDAYLKDTSPGAYEKLVDRLLASSHYGERWGQHWLDLAGYSDSEGFGQDDGVRPFAWRYRDYVIRSLNADKPYTQFITEQIAGDELSDDWKKAKGTADQTTIDRIAATGFLRTTPDPTDSSERGLITERMNILADEVEVLTSSVMGVTVGCARCHNHKYDPIPQRDYYRLSAILQAAYNPYEWKTPNKREVDLALESERKEAGEHNAPLESEIKKTEERIEKITGPLRAQLLDERLAAVPADARDAVRAAALAKAAERTDEQKALAAKYDAVVSISNNELLDKFPDLRAKTRALQEQLNAAKAKLKPKPHIRVLTDNAETSVAYLLRRGDPVDYGETVEAGVPSVLQNAALKSYEPVPPFPGATGRRLALAKWLTQPNHPLTSRVAVNQLWLRHFGRGIVPTVSNFGHSGAPPSHPELLDWLATEFVQNGWSMKSMHRLMVTSTAYRQSSQVSEALIAVDPDNALLSRMPLKRMDAETLYDSILTATGRLDPALFGKPVEVTVTADKEVIVKPEKTGFRRSIYVLHRRQTPMSLLDAFDEPIMTPNCTERRRSNVATQALHMMNGSMAWESARFMAGRVIDEAGADRAGQVAAIYLRAYSRRPSVEETKSAVDAIENFRKQWPARLESDNDSAPRAEEANWLAVANYCHAILNSAEFSFID